jgi:multisubunit Na+/H+ antiporter MnhE subunit
MLLVALVLLSGPAMNFIPWSWTPWPGPLGVTRIMIATFQCHVGLVLWVFGLLLLKNLFERRYWFEWLKMAALCAFCFWQAWGATKVVTWFWPWSGRHLWHLFKG